MAAVGLVIPKAAPVVIAGLGSLAVFVKKKIGKGKKRGDDVRAEDEARTRRREVDADTLAELKAELREAMAMLAEQKRTIEHQRKEILAMKRERADAQFHGFITSTATPAAKGGGFSPKGVLSLQNSPTSTATPPESDRVGSKTHSEGEAHSPEQVVAHLVADAIDNVVKADMYADLPDVPEGDEDAVDDAVRVSDAESVEMSRYLLREEGLFVGSSSAVNVCGAAKVAQRLGPGHVVVTILCDGGARHLSKFWSAEYVERHLGSSSVK